MNALAQLFFHNATIIEALLFGAVIVGCWSVENVAFTTARERKRSRARTNGMFVLCALPIQVALTALCVAATDWVTTNHWGLVYLLPWHESAWIKYGLMFVVLDFLDWIYHFTMHHVPWFWRFHLVHHTDRAMDVSTTVREHPGETVLRNLFLINWVLMLGASLEILVLRQTVETLSNVIAHTSFRLPPLAARMFGWVLITPNLHHVHHHSRRPYTDRNYGDVFSLWDRILGTFATLPTAKLDFGLDTHATPHGDDGFRRTMVMPFDHRPVAATL